jgi:small subunit ribosomal protein S20
VLPHHKSAKKRLRTSKVRRSRNRSERAEMRAAVRSFRQTATGPESAEQNLGAMYRLLDVTARKGVIPKKRAARLKSRLAGRLAKSPSGS